MPEIKFRAFNKRLNVRSDYVTAIQNGDTQGTPSSVNVIIQGKNETWNVKNDDVILEQYVGLKDVDSEKEIYVGDHVEFWCNVTPKLMEHKIGKIWSLPTCFMLDNLPLSEFGWYQFKIVD
ncbi:YopX family protein [Liquorilactobacillus hordei]|uniref:YopX family protein n=1 Tax=Liquorilactobacillus hordei TaxID=468911 RepID=UPI0039ECF627